MFIWAFKSEMLPETWSLVSGHTGHVTLVSNPPHCDQFVSDTWHYLYLDHQGTKCSYQIQIGIFLNIFRHQSWNVLNLMAWHNNFLVEFLRVRKTNKDLKGNVLWAQIIQTHSNVYVGKRAKLIIRNNHNTV